MTGTSALLGALGLVGIVFAIFNLVIGIVSGGLDPFWVFGNLAVGSVLLVIAAVTSFDSLRERMSTGEARRAGRYGTSSVLSTVLAIAILGGLGFLATRYPVRFDWSEAQVHSLSDQTEKVLAGLEQDVEVVALFRRIEMQPVRELLDRYTYESERFDVRYADPNERPELLERYAISPEELGSGVLRMALGEESTLVSEVTEEKVTNALVKLTRTGEKVVYVLEGHNERAIEGEPANERQGYGRAAAALRNENYRVEKLLLAAKGDVPEDADAVIVAGATRPLLDAEHEALRRYLGRGGALLVLLDPRAQTDLYEDLGEWGVEVGDDVIIDRSLALFGRAASPFAASYDESHEITRDLRDTTLFHLARSVSAGDAAGEFSEIVFTGESSWAERDLSGYFNEGRAEYTQEEDLLGPVPVAVAGYPATGGAAAGGQPDVASAGGASGDDDDGDTRARLAVYGDSDFASNELIEAYRNRDLFLNTVNWLMGDVEAISIRPRRSRASRFQLSQAQFTTIRSLSLFVLPEAVAVAGVFVWWSRRNPARRSRA